MDRARRRPAHERAAFLDKVCGNDDELRQAIESLLRFDDQTAFLDEPVFDVHDEDPDLGQRLGPYEIVDLLGRGGMGKVYLARRRDDFDHKVAIKLIQRGIDSDEVLRRFHNERQILAGLEHPNIARLLDGGTAPDERPYFVMEYVEGEPIDRYCDRHSLPVRKRLELFRQVCSAVQVSHQKLIVHRDLKPGNVLVTSDGGVPKLLDFGIAKMLGPEVSSRALATRPGQRPMTLKYASPEQILGDTITTASDSYSLGVLLFQLLTGCHPYESDPSAPLSDYEILQRICHREPPKPSTAVRHRVPVAGSVDGGKSSGRLRLARRLTGDLDAIVLKALRKEPEARYGSVEQFSEDVRRYLTGLPVIARKGTFLYRAGKFVRRNRLGLLVLAFIVVASIFSVMQWRQAVRERERADQAFQFLVGLFEKTDPNAADGRELTARELLARGREELAEILEEDPRLWTDLVDTLGRVNRELGFYDEALELLEASLRALRTRVPGDDQEIAKRLNNIAVLHYQKGDHARAEDSFRKAWAMLQRLDLEDSDTVGYTNNLATILANRGDFDEAEEIYRHGLDLRIAADGCEHPRVAKSFRSLGNLLFLRGDLERAERYLRHALEIRRREYGPSHTAVATVTDKLAEVLAAQGRDAEAESLYRGVLAIRGDRLGEDHALTARTQWKLAAQLLANGDLAAGKSLLDSASETLRRVKESHDDDWELAVIQGLTGVYLARSGRYSEAETLLLESHALIRAARGEHAIYTHNALQRILDLYEEWGRTEELVRYRDLAARGKPAATSNKQPGEDPGCLSAES